MAVANSDPFEALRKLAELKDQGVLTEDEFAEQKARVLRAMSSNEPRPVADAGGSGSQRTARAPQNLQPGEYISWNELIASDEIGDVLKSNVERYRQKFQRIADSSGIGASALADPHTAAKIVHARSFSWAGLLLGPFWAAYRGIYLWQFILAATCIIASSEGFLPLSWGAAGNIAVYITCALFGNVLLLTALGKQAAAMEKNGVPFLGPTPSWGRASLALGAVLVSAIVSVVLTQPRGLQGVPRTFASWVFPSRPSAPSSNVPTITMTTGCDATAYDDETHFSTVPAGTSVVMLDGTRVYWSPDHKNYYKVVGPKGEDAWMMLGAFKAGCSGYVKHTSASR
jgi:hypothetical protein